MGLRARWDPGEYLKRLDDTLGDPGELLDIIGLHAVAHSGESFDREEWDGDKWQDKPTPNWAGIINDLMDGRNEPLAARLARTKTLHDTGNLAKSITFDRIGTFQVEIGSNLPYSGKLQWGGEGQIGPWDRDVRRRLWLWMKKQAKSVIKELGWMLNKKWLDEPVRFTHPERPFVGITPDLQRQITRDIERYVTGEL